MEDIVHENGVGLDRPNNQRRSSSSDGGDGSDLATSTENIQYREKVESLSSCVKKLHQELQSEKLRVEGLKTVSVCLEEERAENEHLRKEVQAKDAQLENYKSRLYSLGHSTSLSMGEEDFIVPGQSKQVVDNLMRENARLKQNLKYSSGEAGLVEEVQVELRELQREVERLRNEKDRLERELATNQMQSSAECNVMTGQDKALLSSQDYRETELRRLRQRISELERTKETQDALCESLSEESVSLKQKLRDTGELCQKLACRLEQRTKQPSVQGASQQLSAMKPGAGPRTTTEHLERENKRLSRELDLQLKKYKEVVEVNGKWQLYGKQKEEQIRTLQQKVFDLDRDLMQSPQGRFSEEQQERINQVLLGAQQKNNILEEEKNQLERENHRLLSERENLNSLVEDLQQRLTAGSSFRDVLNTPPRDNSGDCREHKERIHMLEEQVKICTEDFQSERRDRERAQTKISEMEEELVLARSQLQEYQGSQMNRLAERRNQALNQYCNEYTENYHGNVFTRAYPGERRLVPRGLYIDGAELEEDSELPLINNRQPVEGVDEVDCAPDGIQTQRGPHIAADSGNTIPMVAHANICQRLINHPRQLPKQTGYNIIEVADGIPDNTDLEVDGGPNDGVPFTNYNTPDWLQCPRCKRDYHCSEQQRLLDHIDICCD